MFVVVAQIRWIAWSTFIPQSRTVVVAAGGQGAPIWTKRHREDGVGVAAQGEPCGVPEVSLRF
jgi:hypothetical protein